MEVVRSEQEKQEVVSILQKTIQSHVDDEVRSQLQAQQWVIRFDITDEDTILDKALEPETEAAAFRAVDWLIGLIDDQRDLIVI